MDDLTKDARFAHISSDPKFRRIPKRERKVQIDNRFKSMFNDKKFTVKYTIDKRGRPINQTSSENLKKFYDLPSDEEEKLEEPKKNQPSTTKKVKDTFESSKPKKQILTSKKPQLAVADVPKKSALEKTTRETSNDDDQTSESIDSKQLSPKLASDDAISDRELEENERQLNIRRKNESNKIAGQVKQKLRDLTVDYARGEGIILSDSSSDEESSEDEADVDETIDHNWGELDRDAERTDEITSRLAACNMDWDRIRAMDLMIVFNSFLPPGGIIKSVTIYPSEFGLERMKQEEVMGPIELTAEKEEIEREEDDEEGSEYHTERMRQYQLNRLKYYYAVVVFDSPTTANKVYSECDGIEYESTSTKMDLRFIPDGMEFEEEPKEVCTELPNLPKYKPRQFTTTALQQVNVKLTWDETNPERQEIAEKMNSGKLDELNDHDIGQYVASGSSDEESEQEEAEGSDDEAVDRAEKYRMLMNEINEQEEKKSRKDIDLECTWDLGIKSKSEKFMQEKMAQSETMTPFDKYLEKRKQKKLAKKQKKVDENASDSEDSVPSDVDMNDPYFAEEFGTADRKKMKKQQVKGGKNDDEEEKQRKAELELLLLDKEEDGKRHFNMKAIEESQLLTKSKKKRLSRKKKEQQEGTADDNFEVDVHDPRFQAVFTSHEYNIDPANPQYRKTKGTEALVTEKLKRRVNNENKEEIPAKQAKTQGGKLSNDLAALVKSVKINTKNISKRIKSPH